MSNLSVDQRIEALGKLGDYILEFDERLMAHIHRAEHRNPWFTQASQKSALAAMASKFLDRQMLREWIDAYPSAGKTMTVGVIAAGNIPAVAFHDILSVFATGHRAQIKLSERDNILLPYLIKKLGEIEPGSESYFNVVDNLAGFDAVIATGSNNSSRYFEQYFGKYPNIIRKNRNAVAVLTGDETEDELRSLASDVFEYFGLGCRNVSHIMVPTGYDLDKLKEPFNEYSNITEHSKYRNNYDYNLAIFILNRDQHNQFDNVLLVPSESFVSPIGCLYYSEYSDLASVRQTLEARADELQCVVAGQNDNLTEVVPFGQAQQPGLMDYADGVDTMKFLTSVGA